MLTSATMDERDIELLLRRECDCFDRYTPLEAARMPFHDEHG